jgi:hypothetical protein
MELLLVVRHFVQRANAFYFALLRCAKRRITKNVTIIVLMPKILGSALFVTSFLVAAVAVHGLECSLGSAQDCSATAFRSGSVPAPCITNDRTGTGTGCKTDPCSQYITGTSCVDGDQCSAVLVGQFQCSSSQLLCWSLNQTQCALRSYCKWVTGSTSATSYCNYTVPDVAPATARAAELTNNCPAIHPVVLAIIVMFVTLLIAVGIVLFVVLLNKKKQEELEREEEEAEAEAAIGRL